MKKNTVLLFFVSLVFFLIIFPGKMSGQLQNRYATESKLNSGRWVKIKVYDSGVYQMTFDNLRKWGFSDPSKVKVFGYGGAMLPEDFSGTYTDDLPEVPVLRTGDRLIFYAQGTVRWYNSGSTFVHERNLYSDAGYYFLSESGGEPEKIATVPFRESASAKVTEFFDDYALYEKELINLGRGGRTFFGDDFLYTTDRSYSFDIPGVTEGDIKLQMNFGARSTNGSNKLRIYANNSLLGEQVIDALVSKDDIVYCSTRLVSVSKSFKPDLGGSQTIRVQFVNSSGNASNARLDFIRLNMTRELKLYDGLVTFRSLNARSSLLQYVIHTSGVSSPVVWDVTDAKKPVEMQTNKRDNSVYFTPQSVGLKEYVAFDASRTFATPEYVGTVNNQNLHGYGYADLLIIVPKEFYSQAERLAQFHKEKDNLTYAIVTPELIFNEFSSGTPDATAYRRFAKMFYDRANVVGDESLRPRYLLLFGDGSYDNRHITEEWKGYPYPFLLTFQGGDGLRETDSSTFLTDDYFGFLDDNEGKYLNSDVLDIGIGRFPVRTLDEATTAVDKVIAYATGKDNYGSWKNDICFVADDGNGGEHMDVSDKMANTVEATNPEFFVNKVYIDAFEKASSASGGTYPDAKKRMFDLLDKGLLVINYVGHGSTEGWTAEKLLEMSDIKKMYLKRWPLWITATCDFSRFDDRSTSGGEELFLNPKGGGIALFTTTRVVMINQNRLISQSMAENLFDRNPQTGQRLRLGDVMRMAKKGKDLGSDYNKLNFVLLGDPALRLGYPEHKMVITEIDGKPVKDGELYTLKGRSRVTVKGEVRDYETGTLKLEDFNGFVCPRLYDSATDVKTHGNGEDKDAPGKPFDFKERTNLLYSGKDSIRGGEFSFEFKVPRELNYAGETGLLNLYGYDSNGSEASGAYQQIILGGDEEDDSEPLDEDGPVIHSMYLNYQSFRSGDKVNETPVFFADVEDESGINVSGVGIGHNMTVMIDNSPLQEYVVNNYFTPTVGVFGRGLVKFELPAVSDGSHKLTFKVWDTEGNSSEKTISFTVKTGLKPYIYDLYPERNPVSDVAKFYLKHDRPDMNIRLKMGIYDLNGTELWSTETEGKSDLWTSEPIVWNLTDKSGRRVAPGVYLYRAYIGTEGSKEATKTKKIIILAQ